MTKSICNQTSENVQVLPVVKKNLLVMICSFNEAKVVLQRGNKSIQSLGIGGISVEDPDGDCTLQASSLYLTYYELHLVDKHRKLLNPLMKTKRKVMFKVSTVF